MYNPNPKKITRSIVNVLKRNNIPAIINIHPVCRNELFQTLRAQLNTPVATFFNFDWANKSATCYICSKCTHISWFLRDQNNKMTRNSVIYFLKHDARNLPFDKQFDVAIILCEGGFPLMETYKMNFEILKNVSQSLKGKY